MATKTEVHLYDDINGERIEEGQGETLKFSFDGRSYSIDLTEANAKAFREAIKPYLDAAQPATASSPRATRSTGSKQDKGYMKSVRAWAQLNGVEVNARGRVPADVIAQYEAANAA